MFPVEEKHMKHGKTELTKIVLIVVLVIMGLTFIATTFLLHKEIKDIDGAMDAANRYCEMVYTGRWPDYQQNYAQFCDKDRWNGK